MENESEYYNELDVKQLDLSNSSIKIVPNYVDQYKSLENLYLNNNSLKYLPDSLFLILINLKWLDVRNNLLSTLPHTVANHRSLEIILLQGNQIKELPLELGLVPNLRGFQVIGNPIEFPPPEVINRGTQFTLNFLKNEWSFHSQCSIRPIEEPFYKKTNVNPELNIKERKLQSKSAVVCNVVKKHPSTHRRLKTSLPPISVVSCHTLRGDVDHHLYSRNTKIFDNPFDSVFNSKHCISPNNTNKLIKVNKQKSSLKKQTGKKGLVTQSTIYKSLLKDMWISKIKYILQKQNEIIQKQKDSDVLSSWRKDALKLQQMNQDALEKLKSYEFTFPFDINEDYLSMLTRSDLQSVTSDRKMKKTFNEINLGRTVVQEMADIMSFLQNYKSNVKDGPVSPRSEKKALKIEINQLTELYQRLQALKFHNSESSKVYSKPIAASSRKFTEKILQDIS